nr:hypothetical protein BDOA9_0141430 [Bradyrhizobium sp. DOA9]
MFHRQCAVRHPLLLNRAFSAGFLQCSFASRCAAMTHGAVEASPLGKRSRKRWKTARTAAFWHAKCLGKAGR